MKHFRSRYTTSSTTPKRDKIPQKASLLVHFLSRLQQ